MSLDVDGVRAIATARRVLVLAGPTGVGKSDIALNVARRLGGEIVSADSVQVYQGLDVGANKASVEERNLVRHHMLDIIPPPTEFSAGRFLTLARQATDDVLDRSAIPVIVGGTMMYVRWFVKGRPATPPPTQVARSRAAHIVDSAQGDWTIAIAALSERDPARAAALFRNDWYRLRRALEVAECVPGGVSALPRIGASPKADVASPALPYDLRCVFLYDDRVPLNRRIDARCEDMIAPLNSYDDALHARSVLAESARLVLSCGRELAGSTASRAIGYRQSICYLAARALDANAEEAVLAFRAYVADFQQATRNYAKQQIKWFRKEPEFRWIRTGDNAADALMRLMHLDAAEYATLAEFSTESQNAIREDIMQQGKLMKTYLPAKVTLINDSDAEKDAVQLAESLAAILNDKMQRDDLSHILGAVRKRDSL